MLKLNIFNNNFKVETLEWTRLKLLGISPFPRLGWLATINKMNVYFYGGFNGEIFFSDLHVLNLDTMTW